MARKKSSQETRSEEPKESVVWTCHNCQGEPTFDRAEFIEHMKTVHGFPETIQGKRKMVTHIDGRTYFASVYEWTIGDLRFTQSVRCERAADDLMRFA